MRTDNDPSGRRGSTFIERQRREQVITAATELIARSGYRQASLARIAEHAGISKSVISYHFKGRDELMEQVVRRCFTRVWERMEPALEAASTPTEQIRAWISVELEAFATERESGAAAFDVLANHKFSGDGPPLAREAAEATAMLTQIIASGQANGEFRASDPAITARIIEICIEGAVGRIGYDPGFELGPVRAEMLDMIERGLRA